MKKSFIAVLAAVMAALTASTHALTLDVAEGTAEKTVEITETADLSSEVAPGINVLTGTKAPATFEETDTSYFSTIVPDSTFNGATKSIFPQSTGASFRIEHYYWNRYGTLKFTGFTPENGRKYHVSFREFVEKETAITTTWGAFINNTAAGHVMLHTDKISLGETWQTISVDFVSNGTQLALQQRFCPGNGTNEKTVALYLDDIAIYPYYKVTYRDFDGTDLASEWVLLDGDGALLDKYVPDSSLIENKYTDFSTSLGGDKVTSVPLNGNDIVLYPYTEAFKLTVNNYVLNASTTAKATVSSDTAVEWTVDVGKCEATYTITDTAVTVTPGKYSGIVTVSAELDGEIKSEKIYIVNSAYAKPGLNVITGTIEKTSFDDEFGAYAAIGKINSQYSSMMLVENPKLTSANASAKALNISQADWQRYGEFLPAVTLEAGRKYTLMYDEYVAKDTAITETYGALLYATDSNGHVVLFSNKQGFGTDWQHISGSFISGTNPLRLQQRFCSGSGTNGTPIEIYIDNFAIYPHYKVTYLDYDGNVVATEWVLFDSEGKLLTEYVPNLSLVSAKGIEAVALTSDGKAVDKVALDASDIVLYPVKQELTVATTANVINAADGNTVTLTASKNVSWTVDAGASEATYTSTAKEIVITAKGYSGVVNVTANDGENSKTVTVHLTNGTKAKPGLNAITGTTEKASFEDAHGAYASIGTINSQYSALKISNNPKSTDKNNSGKTLNISQADWQRYGLFTFAFVPESERQYTIMFDEYVAKDTAITETFGAFLAADDKGANIVFHSNNQGFGTDWQTFSGSFISGGTELKLQQRFCSGSGTNGTAIEIYMDNIAVYPNYKITYMNFDGSVAATEWVLLDDNGNVLTEYTPDTSKVNGASGFSLTEGGIKIEKVALQNEDIVLYPIACADMLDAVSFRTITANSGIRFAAYLTENTRNASTEYGFIVARADAIEASGADVSALKFGTAITETSGKITLGKTDVVYVNGVAYKKDGENIVTDIVYSTTGDAFGSHSKGDGYYFTCVLTGMTEKAHFETKLVVRPYVKVGDLYFYGNAKTASLFEEMDRACKDHWDRFSEKEQSYFNSVYEICGASRE